MANETSFADHPRTIDPRDADLVERLMDVLRTAYAFGYTDRPGDRNFSDNEKRLRDKLLAVALPSDATITTSPLNTGNIVYRGEEWVPLEAYREAMDGWKAANAQRPTTCERCQGNGEIVGDWERYLNPEEGDVGDDAVAPCPDCGGTGDTPKSDLRTIERAEWLRLSKVECAARDARDAILGVVDNHKELGALTKLVLEKAAEELRVAINGEAESD